MAAMAIGRRSLGAEPLADQPPAHHMPDNMPGDMAHDKPHASSLPALVSFPYGFPEAGDYRIFVQVRRGGRIDTGVFDAHVR